MEDLLFARVKGVTVFYTDEKREYVPQWRQRSALGEYRFSLPQDLNHKSRNRV